MNETKKLSSTLVRFKMKKCYISADHLDCICRTFQKDPNFCTYTLLFINDQVSKLKEILVYKHSISLTIILVWACHYTLIAFNLLATHTVCLYLSQSFFILVMFMSKIVTQQGNCNKAYSIDM